MPRHAWPRGGAGSRASRWGSLALAARAGCDCLAVPTGFEPAAPRLTTECSTAELRDQVVQRRPWRHSPDGEARTPDLPLPKRTRYQLRYIQMCSGVRADLFRRVTSQPMTVRSTLTWLTRPELPSRLPWYRGPLVRVRARHQTRGRPWVCQAALMTASRRAAVGVVPGALRGGGGSRTRVPDVVAEEASYERCPARCSRRREGRGRRRVCRAWLSWSVPERGAGRSASPAATPT